MENNKIELLENYLPKTDKERSEMGKSPMFPSILDYFRETYPIEYMVSSTENENFNITIMACAKYQFAFSKWITTGNEVSGAHEVAFQAAKDHIDGAIIGMVKDDSNNE